MPGKRDDRLLAEIGKRIAEVRKSKGMTQERLAEVLGMEPTTISRQETGHRSMSISTLAAIADVFRVGLGDLLDGHRPLPTPVMSGDAEELLTLFEGFSSDRKRVILDLARELVE